MRNHIVLLCLFLTTFQLLDAQIIEKIEPYHIRTVQFRGPTPQAQLPVIELGDPLHLSFDDINGNEADYYYKITHHNFDWSISDLSKGEYMDGFDDVRIENYDNSLNSLQIYSNYQLIIPNRETRAIKVSGNYLLSLYDDDGELVFTRKFMIIQREVGVTVAIKRARDLSLIEEIQSVQFIINSGSRNLINPKKQVKTLVLQNSNLESAITDLIPQYTIGNELIYKYDTESSFWAGNEFYNFDNKDIRAANIGIRGIKLTDIYNHYLFTNISRKDRVYTYNPDINGNFEVRSLSAQKQSIEAEYARMHFQLQYFEDIGDKEIHLYGNFNNWATDESTLMKYDEITGMYRNERLFKQGFYNYKYVLVDPDGSVDPGAICGNFWQTENDYIVLVYYRDLGGRFDRLIGMGRANSTTITNN